MYGYETESSSQSFNATINVNDEVITLPEPVPYDELPTWRTRVTLTTRHADASTTVHKNILALFSGEDLYSNLVQLWKELKKQYNAVLQKLLTLEDSNQLVFEMHMFSERGHESYRREISDGRFSRILLLLFQEMSDGKIDSSETSFDVKSDIDERFTDPTPPSSPASSIRSIGELSLDSFTSFSESIAFGGFSGDPYGTVQIFPESHPGTPTGSPTSTLAAESIVMVEAEAQTNAVIPETVGPLPLFTTNTHSSSSKVSEGAQRVYLSDSSSSVSLSTGRSSTERRRQSDDHVTNINQSRPIKLSDLKDVQAEIPPTFTPRTESPVQPPELEAALQMAEQEGLLSDSDNSLGDKSDGFHDDLPGATGFTDEHMHGNGNTVPLLPPGTIPVSFEDTRSEQDEQAIITEIQLNLQPGEEILLEANELRKLNGLPLTADVLTVLVRALEGSKASGLQGIAQGGIDTILCLDLSASTEGKAVEQMKSVLMEFLSDAEALSVNRNLSENIGIVVFGVETEIRAQLNIDYSELLDKICNLQVGGTSPLHTALVLCGIALKENGGPMSLGGYIVPPRIVVFTDGRPTADSQMNNPAAEHGTKPSEIGERVKATVHQLHHQGYTLFTVPVGNHINRMFLQDIASIGGGKMVNLEDFRFIKKYFNYQVVAGTVIQRCHETGNRKNYAEFIAGEINQSDSGLDEDDTMNITEIIHTSRELDDEEHDSLPPLGSRVQVLSEEASLQPLQFGTVVQNLPDGWIKVQLDEGLIHFYHYSNSDREEVKLVNTPRQLQKDQLIEVGVFVCSKEEPNKIGVVFRVTNSGYVDVRWENGTKSRHKYGADGEFTVDIEYDSQCPEDTWKWEDFETQQWISFDPQNQLKIEQAFQKKEKTCLIDLDTDRVRIVFDRGHMKYLGKDIVISVKRFENT